MRKLVLVEPICTGSRLLYLAKVVECFQKDASITVLIRSNYKTPFFDEVMGGLNCEVIPVDADLGGDSIRNLRFWEWRKYLSKLVEYDSQCHEDYDLVFMALDDYFFSFLLGGLTSLKLRRARSRFAFKYGVNSLLNPFRSFRNTVLFFWMHLSCVVWNLQLIVFNESLKHRMVGMRRLAWVPDFWSGGFRARNRTDARKKYGYSDQDFVALTIGNQSERKGVPFLLKALPVIFNEIPNFKICVHGKMDAEYKEPFSKLCDQWEDRIKHCPEFILEEELPFAYAMADVILLPYSPVFCSTSGVLPRAAASGVPVIASEHGLIGHRVTKHEMGQTFKYGDVDSFIQSIKRIRASGGWSQSGLDEFAGMCSEAAFKETLRKIILDKNDLV